MAAPLPDCPAMDRSSQQGVTNGAAETVVEEPTRSAAPSAPLELGGRLGGLSLPRQVMVLAIWPMLEQLLGFFVGFVDTALAGHLSVPATNAISIAAYVGWLMALVQSSVGVGATAVIARAVGGRHLREANIAVGQAVSLAVAAGLVMLVVVWVGAPWMASFARLEGESHELCVLYLRVMAVMAPFSAVLFVGAACLRGAGDTASPFRVLVVVNIVNVAATLLLVRGPEPIGGHGVLGIALGTALAWLVGAALILRTLGAGSAGIRLRRMRLRPRWSQMKRILRVGLPNLAETLLAMWLANFAIVRIVGEVGHDAAWGAHMIAIRLEALSFLQGFALGIAAATLVGQYLGARNPQRARQAAMLCWVWGMGLMGLMGLGFIFLADPLVRLTTNQPALLELTPPLLMLCGFVQVFFATAIVLGQAMRGAGDTRATLAMTAAATYLVRLPLAWLLGIHLELGLLGVWYALCLELVVRGLLFAGRFFSNAWMRVKV